MSEFLDLAFVYWKDNKYTTYQAIVYGRRQTFEVKPDVESAVRRNVNFKAELCKPLEYVVAFHLEVLLKSDLMYRGVLVHHSADKRHQTGLLLLHMLRIEERNGRKL